MPPKKPEKNPKEDEKKSEMKKEISELSGLEVDLKSSEEESEEKKVSESKEVNAEDFNGIDFSRELSRVLRFQASADSGNAETFNIGGDLEGAVFFAPRSVSRGEERGLNYSEGKYDADLYKKSSKDYESNTPNYAAGSSGAGEGNESGPNFSARSGRNSENGGQDNNKE